MVVLLCLSVLVFFGLISSVGPWAAAGIAVATGILVGLVVKSRRGAGVTTAPAPGGIVTSAGCRFIPLDADELGVALEAMPREKAPAGALPPQLPAVPRLVPSLPESEPAPAADAEPGAKPEVGAPVRAAAPTLRLVGRSASPPPARNGHGHAQPASRPAVAPVRAVPAAVVPSEPGTDKDVCPQCGSLLELRLAMEGPSAGRFIWGCRGFPACRYVRSGEPVDRNGVPARN